MDPSVEHLTVRSVIADVVIRYATGVDTLDGRLLASCFSETVEVDYSPVSGNPRAVLAREPYLDAMLGRMSGFDSTQHIIANQTITIADDRRTAISVAYMQATHVVGGRIWTMGGYYTEGFIRSDSTWLITSIRLDKMWETGHLDLALVARDRAAAGSASRRVLR